MKLIPRVAALIIGLPAMLALALWITELIQAGDP